MDALDLIEVGVEMFLLGQRVLNVFHLVGDQNLDDGDAMADIAEYMDALYDTVDHTMSDTLTFGSILVKNLSAGTLLGSIGFPTLTGGTNGAGAELPTQIAGLVTLPTATPKRRGRKFIPGMVEGNLTAGLFTAGLVTAFGDFGGYLVIPHSMGSGAGWRYVVSTGTPGIGSTSLPTEAVVTNIPAALGRRRIGVGE